MFRKLRGIVSHHCIEVLVREIEGTPNIISCTHELRTTHGLPCACMMMAMKDEHRPLNSSDIHPFWKTLYLDKKYNGGEPETVTADDLYDEAVM